MSNSMVERVAKALAKEDGLGHDFWRQCIPAARAAIEAMREPTDAMCDAADALDRVEHDVLKTALPFDAWIAMVDEALR